MVLNLICWYCCTVIWCLLHLPGYALSLTFVSFWIKHLLIYDTFLPCLAGSTFVQTGHAFCCHWTLLSGKDGTLPPLCRNTIWWNRCLGNWYPPAEIWKQSWIWVIRWFVSHFCLKFIRTVGSILSDLSRFPPSLSLSRYRGSYCSQDVAIKVLKPDKVNTEMLREFAQEVYIMRFVDIYNTWHW